MGDGRWGWLHSAAGAIDGQHDEVAGRVVAGVAVAVAECQGVDLPDLALLSAWGPPAAVALPAGVDADAWLVGSSLEVLTDPGGRRRRGVHHTPRPVAEVVVRMVFEGTAVDGATTVCDPAAGGGALLLAAGDSLVAAGVDRRRAVRNLVGVDVDPLAAATTEAALTLWAHGAPGGVCHVADALSRPAEAWEQPAVVVGNPPFLSQLRVATARPQGRPLRHDLACLAGPYTDTAALFAALAVDVVAPGGRVGLVLPRAFLAARDAGPARAATLRTTTLHHVWLPGMPTFAADIDVCVPVWSRRALDDRGMAAVPPVRRSVGLPPMAVPPAPAMGTKRATWSLLLHGLGDEPEVPALDGLRSSGTLGDVGEVRAGFRDQYYGLIPFVVDDPDGTFDDTTHAPLVTSGLIDPAASGWGRRPARYAGRRWAAPRVDLAAVATAAVDAAGGALARWVAAKRVPKVLVAAQTRAIEAVADVDGTWLPSTPVATVVPGAGRVWHTLAVFVGPVATAWAFNHQRGGGLSRDALRLSPASLRAIPLPSDTEAWDVAACSLQAAQAQATGAEERRSLLASAARSMTTAYHLDPEPLTAWWLTRLPPP